MSNIHYLAEVMTTEAELTERLVAIMKQQQQALVNTDAAAVAESVDQEQELLLPIEGLEQERLRLLHAVCEDIGYPVQDGSTVNLADILHTLPAEAREKISVAGSRLHHAVEEMLRTNQANQYLIEHSRRFVRETFRIVTNGFSRQLVDQKI